MGAVIGVPLYGYLYHYTWLDWSLFGLLYVVSGLGITVGYHRLMAHRSCDCPNWVKGALLIAGAWALAELRQQMGVRSSASSRAP